MTRAPALIAVLIAAAPAFADIVREGDAQRRAELDRIELKEPPADFSKLTEWFGSEPLTSADAEGKVVLICTWAAWYRLSVNALSIAQEMAQKYPEEDLLVIGVHHPRGWERAAAVVASRKITFPIVHDADGAFRSALLVDQDPDFYVVGRAGRLRYADIETGSVAEAVERLVRETPQEAADLPRIMRERQTESRAQARETGTMRALVELTSMPDLPPGYIQPQPDAYSRVNWPRQEQSDDRRSGRRDENQGPRQLTLPTEGRWFPKRPEPRGRVGVVYSINLASPPIPTDMLRRMDRLQLEYGRDINVVCVMTSAQDSRSRRDDEQDPATAQTLARRFEELTRARKTEQTWLFDPNGLVQQALAGDEYRRNTGDLGSAILVSSDGVVRWSGEPTSPSLRAFLDQILRVDPGVQQRRAADERFLRDNAGG